MNVPTGQASLQPNGWPSMLISPVVAMGSSLDGTQLGWELPQMPISPLQHTHDAHSCNNPHGQPSPFPLAPVNGCSPALYCIKGSSTLPIPSIHTQWSSYFSLLPHSSTASPAFAEQTGALLSHELLNNDHSQTE